MHRLRSERTIEYREYIKGFSFILMSKKTRKIIASRDAINDEYKTRDENSFV
jgi:hypothetical protein